MSHTLTCQPVEEESKDSPKRGAGVSASYSHNSPLSLFALTNPPPSEDGTRSLQRVTSAHAGFSNKPTDPKAATKAKKKEEEKKDKDKKREEKLKAERAERERAQILHRLTVIETAHQNIVREQSKATRAQSPRSPRRPLSPGKQRAAEAVRSILASFCMRRAILAAELCAFVCECVV